MEDHNLHIEKLFIYPVKAMSGISVANAELDALGLKYDRRYMLTDEAGRFMTQRTKPELALFTPRIDGERLIVSSPIGSNGGEIVLPLFANEGVSCEVEIWSDKCQAMEVSSEANEFFSDLLKSRTKLVFMSDHTSRRVDPRYCPEPTFTSFTDGYPILLSGTASLLDLNNRLRALGNPEVSWDRFRPNIVVATSIPYEEDNWQSFRIGDLPMHGVKLCSRCVVTTIDQITLVQGKEPLKTLAQYRTSDHKVNFGQNVAPLTDKGRIALQDLILV